MIDKKIFAKIKLINNELQELEGIAKPPRSLPMRVDLYDELVTDTNLRKLTRKLFFNGHHAQAVEAAYKYIDNHVKRTIRPHGNDLTGQKLMTLAFSATSPLIKLNAFEGQSEKDEQLGYMQIFAGCMTGIRNPRAHESDWEDVESRALQLLIWANHLVERINMAQE